MKNRPFSGAFLFFIAILGKKYQSDFPKALLDNAHIYKHSLHMKFINVKYYQFFNGGIL